jgi:hypothetical protein
MSLPPHWLWGHDRCPTTSRAISEMPSFVGSSDGLAIALNANARDKKRPIAFSAEDVEKTLNFGQTTARETRHCGTARLIRDDQHLAGHVQEAVNGCGKYPGGDCRRASRLGLSARRPTLDGGPVPAWLSGTVRTVAARLPSTAQTYPPAAAGYPGALVSLPCTSCTLKSTLPTSP